MNESEYLQEIILETLIEENQFWDCTDHVKKKITGKVVYRNCLYLLESSCSLDKVQGDLEKINDINGPLDVLKCLLARVQIISKVLVCEWVFILVDIWENNHKWCHEHAINSQYCDQEVPNLAEGPLCVDKVPLELWLILVDGAVLVGIFIDIIDHHLFQVGLCHLLKSSLEPQFVVVTSCFHP
jgi:hypothetical protein